jgi:hypothetical protein
MHGMNIVRSKEATNTLVACVQPGFKKSMLRREKQHADIRDLLAGEIGTVLDEAEIAFGGLVHDISNSVRVKMRFNQATEIGENKRCTLADLISQRILA